MNSIQLQLARGTTADTSSFTGLAGEVSVDTTKKAVVVHDGATPGGFPSQNYLNVRAFGAIGDGTTDDTAAIQAALDAASPLVGDPVSGATSVYLPSGTYLITETLDLTNSRGTGTIRRDGLRFFGDGFNSVLLGQTGADKAVMETTGTQYLRIEGMRIDTTTVPSDQSTIGVFSGVSDELPQTQNQVYRDFYIDMHDAAGANGGVGTVCFWNFGSEENTYGPLWFRGNVCFVLTSSNDGPQPGGFEYDSYQAPLMDTHSLTLTTFSGECFLVATNNRNASVIIQNVTGLDAQQMYLSNTGTGGSSVTALHFTGNATGLRWHGNIEGRSSVDFDGALINSTMNLSWGGVDSTTTAALRVNRSNSNGIIGSKVTVTLEANYGRSILSTKDGNESSTSNYFIQNSEFIGRNGDGSTTLYIPANVAANAGTVRNRLLSTSSWQADLTSFAAGLTSDISNATGNGVMVSLNSNAFTEEFDVGSCFNASTGVFTAKLNGFYEFSGRVRLVHCDANHDNGALLLKVGSQQYYLDMVNPGTARTTAYGNGVMLAGSVKLYLTTGQTAYLQVGVEDGTQTITIESGGSGVPWRTRFEGNLVQF